MTLQICLKLAEYARKDSTLIKNHTDGSKGVDHYLRKHLDEIKYLLEVVGNDSEFIKRLEAEKVEVISALEIYK
jgi:hypothetical protein